jgi:hypothetical protein
LNAVLVALLVLAVSTTIWIVVLRGESGPVTKVSVTEPTSSTVDCTSPVVFRATIRTKAQATVTYHWESTAGSDSAKAELIFAEATEQSIETTQQLQGSSGDEIKMTLVIDAPNSKKASRVYRLTCK